MTDWEKFLDRRTKNIGFLSKVGGFREPTAAEKEAAYQIELQNWIYTRSSWNQGCGLAFGKTNYKITPISDMQGQLLWNKEHLDNCLELRQKEESAKNAYMKTPMELVGKFKDAPIDLTPYVAPKKYLLQRLKIMISDNAQEIFLFAVTFTGMALMMLFLKGKL
jgi:hypothetical protein